MTRAFALELARRGTRVNAVAPALTEVPRFFDEEWYDRDEVAAILALGRVPMPADIAGVVSFLAGTDSSVVTGQVLRVDAGSSIGYAQHRFDG